MRARHADRFNLDSDASVYDRLVADEGHIIRRGYAACLRAIAEDIRRGPGPADLPITELGVGTGALTALLPSDRSVVAVDISEKMICAARQNLEGRSVSFLQAEILEHLTHTATPLGTVVSTFAFHSLESDEKQIALDALAARMRPGARLCIGDLGLADATAKTTFLDTPSNRREDWAEAVERHFWDWSVAEAQLRTLGFRVRRRSHGPLIASLVATRDSGPEAAAPTND